jgi:hypothetical protein
LPYQPIEVELDELVWQSRRLYDRNCLILFIVLGANAERKIHGWGPSQRFDSSGTQYTQRLRPSALGTDLIHFVLVIDLETPKKVGSIPPFGDFPQTWPGRKCIALLFRAFFPAE